MGVVEVLSNAYIVNKALSYGFSFYLQYIVSHVPMSVDHASTLSGSQTAGGNRQK